MHVKMFEKSLPIMPQVHIAPKRQVKFKMNLIKMPEYVCILRQLLPYLYAAISKSKRMFNVMCAGVSSLF